MNLRISNKWIKVEVILKFKGKKELRKFFNELVNCQNSSVNSICQEVQKLKSFTFCKSQSMTLKI